MTNKATLEEIEAEVASLQCKPIDHSTHPSHMVYRLLEICREQVAREAKKDHEIHCLKTAIREANAALMAEEGTTVTYNLPEGGAAWTILREICKHEIG